MRRTAFNEPVFQPGDEDFFGTWTMEFGEEPDREIARFIEYDEEFGWGCEITDNNERTVTCADFESEEALREWLKKNRIEIED